MKKDQLSIRVYGEPIGILEQLRNGKMTFTYNKDATTAISISMPVRAETYNETECKAFFNGLLPENETAKKLIGKKYGISPNNSFALLRAIGYDCAGAISCHTMDEPIISQRNIRLTGKIITEKELYQHIKSLPSNPLFIDVEGLRLSLAGVQDKAAICLIDNQIAFPEENCPTTHIIKPASTHFDGIVANEYFCLKIAKQIGLPVPEIELRKIKDITFLLIARYDRRINNNQITRVHQEDFCQALGVPSIKKYQNEGGPGFKNCFELLKKTAQPAIDRNLLATAAVFNYLIGNMDAHGKNFSLLYHSATSIRLAPFYDIICTRAYPNLTSKMAMKIGSKYDAEQVLPKHWEELCKTIQYSYPAMIKLIDKVGHEIIKVAAMEEEQLKVQGADNPIFTQIINFTEKHIEKTLKRFNTDFYSPENHNN